MRAMVGPGVVAVMIVASRSTLTIGVRWWTISNRSSVGSEQRVRWSMKARSKKR